MAAAKLQSGGYQSSTVAGTRTGPNPKLGGRHTTFWQLPHCPARAWQTPNSSLVAAATKLCDRAQPPRHGNIHSNIAANISNYYDTWYIQNYRETHICIYIYISSIYCIVYSRRCSAIAFASMRWDRPRRTAIAGRWGRPHRTAIAGYQAQCNLSSYTHLFQHAWGYWLAAKYGDMHVL